MNFNTKLIQSSIPIPRLLWNNINSYSTATALLHCSAQHLNHLSPNPLLLFWIKYLVFISKSPQTLHPLLRTLTLLAIPQPSHVSLLKVLMQFPKSFMPVPIRNATSIPSKLSSKNKNTILPIIATIVNLSLTTGTFPINFKQSFVARLLRKLSLNKKSLNNYRQISNLSLLSKSLSVWLKPGFTITFLLILSIKNPINLLILKIT